MSFNKSQIEKLEKTKPEDIPDIISKGKRELAGKTLPPNGLYLLKVEY